jgi:SAM-dependent methyltransferase
MPRDSTSSDGAEFDRLNGTYADALERAVAFSGQDPAFFTEVKAELLIDLARRRIGDPGRLRALDLGCGPGLTDSYLIGSFGEVHGVDVSAAMVEEATVLNPDAHYRVFGGSRTPYEDGAFDLSFAINVFHHVAPPERDALAQELARTVRPGGLVAIIEHNPLNPLTRLAVARCAFDENAVLLGRREAEGLLRRARLALVERRYLLFVPRRAPRVERLLARVPMGAQYLVAGTRL